MARKIEEVGPGEVARLYGISPGTLTNWRTQGIGPKFRKRRPYRNATVIYDLRSVLTWGKSKGYIGGEAT